MESEPIPSERYTELADIVDERTFLMGGGHEHTEEYKALLAEGPTVLPFLVDGLRIGFNYWKMLMVDDLLGSLGINIEYDSSRHYSSVEAAQLVVSWWDTGGQLDYEAKLAATT